MWRTAYPLSVALWGVVLGVSCGDGRATASATTSPTAILYTVSGTVREAAGTPVPDAEVIFGNATGAKSGQPSFITKTDGAGRYSGRIPPGREAYGILVRKPGFEPKVQTGISVLADTMVDVIVRPGALVSGRVTAPDSPVLGVSGVSLEVLLGPNAGRSTISGPAGIGLNDLYVRFYRMAERRIVERTGQGVVCFISNYSWLDGLSHTGMRERYLEAFDKIWIDNLNGDKFRTGKLTPDGKPDPSVFSTASNREGIQVGTAIATLVRREEHQGSAT